MNMTSDKFAQRLIQSFSKENILSSDKVECSGRILNELYGDDYFIR
jgi:hypothetical protein